MDHPVQVVDWMPTLTELAGATPTQDPQWDGADIWSLIDGSVTPDPDKRMYWNFRGGKNLGLRQGNWKLTDREVEENAKESFSISPKTPTRPVRSPATTPTK